MAWRWRKPRVTFHACTRTCSLASHGAQRVRRACLPPNRSHHVPARSFARHRRRPALLMWLYHSSMESFSWPTVASHRIQLLRQEHVAAIVVEQHGECAETKLDGEAHMLLMLAATSRWSSARDAGGVIPWAGRGVRVGAGHRASRPTRWSSVVVRCPIRTCA